jgi:transmembrane sensor
MDVEAALARLKSSSSPDANVVALELHSAPTAPLAPRRRALATWAGIGLAAMVALAAIGLSLSEQFQDMLARKHYRTDIGEQRSLTLSDGSQIELDAVSNLSARIDRTVRDLRLDQGEALFRVAKDPAHAFRVRTPQATIEAKGTQFNVSVRDGTTAVVLLEGHVLVQQATTGASDPASGAILLNPGQELTIVNGAADAPTPRAVDVKLATAWERHRLVFEDAPLTDVIAAFNRYSRQPFAIDDPTLSSVRITASFDAGSTQTFADSLAAIGDLRVTRQPSGSWLIERK